MKSQQPKPNIDFNSIRKYSIILSNILKSYTLNSIGSHPPLPIEISKNFRGEMYIVINDNFDNPMMIIETINNDDYHVYVSVFNKASYKFSPDKKCIVEDQYTKTYMMNLREVENLIFFSRNVFNY